MNQMKMTDMPPAHDWHGPIIAAVVHAYSRFRPVTYVEIGVDRGHTIAAVAPLCHEAHAVDITFANLDVSLPVWRAIQWEMSSDEFFTQYGMVEPYANPDVIFIDGNHGATQVRKDLTNALGIIADDGTVILHDTLPLKRKWMERYCEDAFIVVQETILAVPELQVFTLPVFPGLTFVSKEYRPLP